MQSCERPKIKGFSRLLIVHESCRARFYRAKKGGEKMDKEKNLRELLLIRSVENVYNVITTLQDEYGIDTATGEKLVHTAALLEIKKTLDIIVENFERLNDKS